VAARLALIIAVAVLAAVGVVALLGGGQDTPVPVAPDVVPAPPGTKLAPFTDPFSYTPARRREFEARAAAGNAHVLYALSPGGVLATARRVARYRPEVDRVAHDAGVSPSLLEGLVFLESGGRPDALTAAGTEGAAGLTQIVAETAIDLLGMHVDVVASKRLSRRIARANRQRVVDRLDAQRRAVDDRFDPDKALAATGRYLKLAEDQFSSEELAFVSYHMGIGNLTSVLDAYAGGPTDEPLRYAQVYFDSSPVSHAAAYRKLYALGDDSANYLWKLYAARDIMRLYRTDPAALRQAIAAQTAKASAEEVLHPAASTPAFATPQDLKAAFDAGDIVTLPVDVHATGLRIDPRMGELAKKVGARSSLYRGLRPEALAMALYIGAEVRVADRDPRSALTLSSTVRDQRYQDELVKTNFEATRNFSLHTTGWAFDVLRRYRSPRQALAFQSVLDRLTSLNLIAWVREPAAIHITVSSDAAALKGLLSRVR
jgi:hypothetical protein